MTVSTEPFRTRSQQRNPRRVVINRGGGFVNVFASEVDLFRERLTAGQSVAFTISRSWTRPATKFISGVISRIFDVTSRVRSTRRRNVSIAYLNSRSMLVPSGSPTVVSISGRSIRTRCGRSSWAPNRGLTKSKSRSSGCSIKVPVGESVPPVPKMMVQRGRRKPFDPLRFGKARKLSPWQTACCERDNAMADAVRSIAVARPM